jgi:hypothetical protein
MQDLCRHASFARPGGKAFDQLCQKGRAVSACLGQRAHGVVVDLMVGAGQAQSGRDSCGSKAANHPPGLHSQYEGWLPILHMALVDQTTAQHQPLRNTSGRYMCVFEIITALGVAPLWLMPQASVMVSVTV